MRSLAVRIGLAAGLMAALAGAAAAETRVALVIGNGAYENTGALANPPNDAADFAATLKRLGFDVIAATDVDKAGMDDAFRRFARAMTEADAALFFYAGHGMQLNGVNYLMPVDAELEDEADVPYEMAKLDDILADMGRVDGVRMVILDACRDNPLEQKLKRSLARTRNIAPTRGLAQISRSEGLLIAYATQPGDVADDGEGRNSPFTAALLEHVETPGLEVGALFRRVGVAVNGSTRGRQTPELSVSLLGEFYFKPGEEDRAPAAARPDSAPAAAPAAGAGQATELAFWNAVKDSDNAAVVETYLKQFPDGVFAPLARLRLQDIESNADSAAEPRQQAAQSSQQARRQIVAGPRVVLPHSGAARLTGQDLAGLSCGDLWIARNEIFDRRGYCFKSRRGRDYFDNSDCWSGSQDILSPLEQANVALIQSWERRGGCR